MRREGSEVGAGAECVYDDANDANERVHVTAEVLGKESVRSFTAAHDLGRARKDLGLRIEDSGFPTVGEARSVGVYTSGVSTEEKGPVQLDMGG